MQSTRRGSFSVHRSEKNPRFQIQPDKRPLSPGTSREAGGVPCLNPRRGLTLLSPVCRDPAIRVGNQRYPAVPASTGDEALFQCTKPSVIPRGPSHLQFPWLLRATTRSPLRSPAQVEEPRVSCLNPGKPSRDLLQHVSRPDSPTMAREQGRAPPRHPHGDPTSLAPHERLTDLAVVPREKPHTGAAAREQPRDSPVIER